MRYDLVYAQAQNKAFVPFTTDSIVLAVAEYYDRHGSANERMMARYMVGCAYRDLGDAPTALKHLHLAAEAADTTARDCDFPTLMRIHSQMGGLYQNVMAKENESREDRLAEYIAWQIGDTLAALSLKWGRACGLYDIHHFDECLAIIDSIEAFGKNNNYPVPPMLICPTRINVRLERNDLVGAAKYLRIFERGQGITPDSPDNSSPTNAYYLYKGKYYNLAGVPDSAIIMYGRSLTSSTFNALSSLEKNEVWEECYRGFMQAYSQKHQPDSVIKYANLYCLYNDSTTRMHSSENLLRLSPPRIVLGV